MAAGLDELRREPAAVAEPVSPEHYDGLSARMKEGDLYLLRSDSMFPALRTGDLLLFHDRPAEAGDIIAFQRGSQTTAFVHRVIQLHPAAGTFPYLTKGDNCFVSDAAEEDCRWIGRLRYVWRDGELIDFEQPFRRLLARGLAWASRRNLMPELLKTRFSRGPGDWLREQSLTIALTALLVRDDLQAHHFAAPDGQQGDFVLRRGAYPVGGLHYRTRPGREGIEVTVPSCWLRFPFSYSVVFTQLLHEAEAAWKNGHLTRAVFPAQLCRRGLDRALRRAGYVEEEQGGTTCLARFL